MSPDTHIPPNWRLRGERLRLEGNQCGVCGEKHFPPKMVCPDCTLLGMGTVEFILENKENDKRELELGVRLTQDDFQINIGLNGKSHAIEFKVGMQLPVFVKKSLDGKKYFVGVSSSPSR